MAQTVVMPKLGNTVESCIIVKWKVSEGQNVAADTVLCEIETDKATMDVPAGTEGTVLKILRAEGEDVPVLEAIAIIGTAGEGLEGLAGTAGIAPAAASQVPASPEAAPVVHIVEGNPNPQGLGEDDGARGPAFPVSPRAKALAREEGLSLSSIREGTGPGGRVIERDVRRALSAGAGMTAAARGEAARNEAARDIAVLRGLYEAGKTAGSGLTTGSGLTAGSGLGGRVTESDIKSSASVAASSASAEAPKASPVAADVFPGSYIDTPIKSIRKIIADRMMHSLQASAQLTFNASAPADRLLALRKRLKDSDPALGLSGVTIGDLVAFAAVRVLAKYPKINAHVIGGVLRSYGAVHLGLAVDTPRGLMVPVIRDAGSLPLREFSERSKALAKSCVDGSPNPDLLSGSTFTVTNLGAFGIESFTPILNEPETGILGVDAIVPRAFLGEDGKPGVEMRIGFSLTVDHRVVDGADAARYLRDLANYIADIDIAMFALKG